MKEMLIEPRRREVSPTASKRKIKRSSFSYILLAFVIVFLLVFQLIFSVSIQEWDVHLLKGIQTSGFKSFHDSTFFKVCSDILYYYTEPNFINGALCFLYCAFNPFISFKVSLLANIAMYIHSIAILLIYCEPKPYWIEPGLYTSDCESVFTGPSYNQFMATLLAFYSITVFKRYQVIRGRLGNWAFIGIFTYLNLMTLMFSIFNAQHFIYQNFLGIVIAVIVVVATNVLDNSISLLSLRLGFFIKSSKKYKFMFLVVLLLAFSLCMAFAIVVESSTLINADWIVNYNVFYE